MLVSWLSPTKRTSFTVPSRKKAWPESLGSAIKSLSRDRTFDISQRSTRPKVVNEVRLAQRAKGTCDIDSSQPWLLLSLVRRLRASWDFMRPHCCQQSANPGHRAQQKPRTATEATKTDLYEDSEYSHGDWKLRML